VKTSSENNSNHLQPVKQQPNAAIKQGVGAKVTGSAVYQQDEKMHGQGAMQKGLDTWLKEDWAPTFADEDKAADDGTAVGKKEKAEKSQPGNKTQRHAEKHENSPEATSVKKVDSKIPEKKSTTTQSSTTEPSTTEPSTTKQPEHFTLQYYYDRLHKYLNKKEK